MSDLEDDSMEMKPEALLRMKSHRDEEEFARAFAEAFGDAVGSHKCDCERKYGGLCKHPHKQLSGGCK